MARLVEVLNEDYMKENKLTPKTIYSKLMPLNVPITVDDVLIVCDAIMKNDHALEMVMEINVENNVHLTQHGLNVEHEPPTREEYQKFMSKYKLLSKDELKKALTLTHREVTDQMSKMVPCVGCRRSAESAYLHATQKGYRAYYPFQTTTDGSLFMAHDMIDFKSLFALFMDPSDGMRSLLASFNKFSTFKKGKRCNIHSLDSQRGRSIDSWMDVWDYMTPNCRKEIGTIKRTFFAETLEGYLRKHRFCTDCKATVLRAYGILTEVIARAGEPGFILDLYDGIDYDLRTDEIYVPYDTESIGALISRAVPELSGSNRRERHAKTMETAQEEILTCLGVCIFERLHRIQQRFREEERGWEIVMCVAIQALRQSYELALHDKSGMASLQWLLEQEKQEEAKKRKKTLKKQRRKEKKQAEEQLEAAEAEGEDDDEENGDENRTSEINYESSADTEPTVIEVNTKVTKNGGKGTKGQDKKATAGNGQTSKCSSETQDCGYASGNNNNRSETSTPLGSDTACSEGFCSHENSCGLKQVCETATPVLPVPVKPEPVKVEQAKISKLEPTPTKASKKKPRGPMLFTSISFNPELPAAFFAPKPYLTLEEQLDESELANHPIPLGDRELHHLSDARVAKKRRKIRASLLEQYNTWRKNFMGDKFIPIEPIEGSMLTAAPKAATPTPEPAKEKKATVEVGGKENKKPKGAGGGSARNSKAQQVSALRRYKGKNRH